MNTVEGRHSPVYRQLEAYEESWKRDHDAVRECWAWEDTIAVGISTDSLIERVDRAWRDRVFRGVEAFREEVDDLHRTRFKIWLRVTEAVLAKAGELKEVYGTVEGAAELREAERRVREHLASWQPPKLSTAVGLREMTLSPQAATELDAFIQRGSAAPPAMPTRRLEAKDASFLKRPS